MSEKLEHSITVTQAKKVAVSGVCEVEAVGEQRVVMSIVGGKRLTILGENLKMGAFSKQTGTFFVEGTINELKYQGEKTAILKRLLK